jgi:hypothetical protein
MVRWRRRSTDDGYSTLLGGWSDEDMEGLLATLRPSIEKRLEEGADPKAIEAALSAGFAEAVPKVIEQIAPQIEEDLRRTSPGMLRWRRSGRAQSRKAIDASWGEVFDLLDIVHHACFEIGATVRHLGPERDGDHRFEALTFLHARACTVASEIDALLRAGYPSGARARWRTLHELAVISSLLGDGDDELSERYLAHTVVAEYKDALDHESTRDRTGLPAYDPADLESLRKSYEAGLERFGKSFKHDWAWAAPTAGIEQPNFRQLEELAGLEHLRTWYRSASHLTHAGSRGTADVVTPVPGGHVLLTGPTNAELSGPAHSTVISLMQVTVTAAFNARPESEPHPAFLAGIRAIQLLVDAVGDAAAAAEDRVEGFRAEDEAYLEHPGRGRAYGLRLSRIRRHLERQFVLALRRRSKVMSQRWRATAMPPDDEEPEPDPGTAWL